MMKRREELEKKGKEIAEKYNENAKKIQELNQKNKTYQVELIGINKQIELLDELMKEDKEKEEEVEEVAE